MGGTPPPALDPAQVTVGINNGPGIYLAPAGTAPPGSLSAAWASPWEPLGYLSDDGVSVAAATDTETLTPWQSVVPIRTLVTGRSFSMQFVMWQTNRRTLALYFDTELPEANAFDVRSDQGGFVYALGIDVQDGENQFRIAFRRSQLSDNGDVSIQRGAAVGWDVTMTALDDSGVLCHVDFGEGPIARSLEDLRRAAASVGGPAGSGRSRGTRAEAETAAA